MFKRLQQKWKVSKGRLILVLLTFALGGSLCGYTGRKLLDFLEMDKGAIWLILYILFITILWPVVVILVSIPLGQFRFFKKYLVRVFSRISGHIPPKETLLSTINIAIFASGAGSNTKKIIEELPGLFAKKNKTLTVQVTALITDNPSAGVLDIAQEHNIPAEIIKLKNKDQDYQGEGYLSLLRKHSIDFIVLAGYLKKIPVAVIKAYPKKIVNIHPSLLPAYGGGGMYGMRVHEAVLAAGETQSGISIHEVDEIYDHGQIIFRAACPVYLTDTASSLADKIRELEHAHYAEVIAEILSSIKERRA